MAKARGRPRKHAEALTERVAFRATQQQIWRWRLAAEDAGCTDFGAPSFSDWMRAQLDAGARRGEDDA